MIVRWLRSSMFTVIFLPHQVSAVKEPTVAGELNVTVSSLRRRLSFWSARRTPVGGGAARALNPGMSHPRVKLKNIRGNNPRKGLLPNEPDSVLGCDDDRD